MTLPTRRRRGRLRRDLLLVIPILLLLVERWISWNRGGKRWKIQQGTSAALSSDNGTLMSSLYGDHRAGFFQTYPLLPLHTLTGSEMGMAKKACPPNQLLIEDIIDTSSKTTVGVPRILHQTGASRCVTRQVGKAISTWKEWLHSKLGQQSPSLSSSWSYYYHDDAALHRLLKRHAAEIPLLKVVLDSDCFWRYGGTLHADVWRYLILWLYGGVYADVDAVPSEETIQAVHGGLLGRALQHNRSIDALFVVEQYHLLSQYFIATTPRHPLMWYALETALLNLYTYAPDTAVLPAALYTGPHALHKAFQRFMKDVGVDVPAIAKGVKPVRAGVYTGTRKRSITVIGVAENQNQYINRDVLGSAKLKDYESMGMTLHQSDAKNNKRKTGRKCWQNVLDRYYDGE